MGLSSAWLSVLLAVALVGEACLLRRPPLAGASRRSDRGSLPVLLVVIAGSLGAAWLARRVVPGASVAALTGAGAVASTVVPVVGLAVYGAGLALRWQAVRALGRWFTYDVAVAGDQPVIDTGPYRRVRHPAYAGSLLTFAGLGLCSGHLLALAVLVLPIAVAFAYRIAVEEKVLAATLGSAYVDYARRTWRLVPFVY